MRVPTITSDGNVSAPYFAGGGNQAAASSIASSANSVSSGLNQLASGLMDVSQNRKLAAAKVAQKQDYDNTIWAESQYTEAQRTWMQWTNDVQKTGEENVLGRFNNEYDKFQTDMLKTAPNEKAKERLKMKLDDLGTRVFDSSLRIQAANQAKNTINTFDNMLTSSVDTVAESPELYSSEQTRLGDMLKMARDQGRITEETYANGKSKVDELSANAAEALVATNPTRAKEIIDGAEGIPWTRRKSVLAQIAQAEKSNDTLYQYQQQELFKSNLDSVSSTGKTVDSFNVEGYVAAFPKARQGAAREEATKQIKLAETVYSGRIDMNGKTPSQINEVLHAHTPKAGAADFSDQQMVYEKLITAADTQVKLFKNDPFTYSRQDPVVNKSWDLVERLPDNADPQLRQTLTTQAMEASLNFQRGAGVPEGNITVVSRDQAMALAKQINEGDAAQVQQAYGQMMQNYGKYYPQAFRSLVKLPEGQRIDATTQIAALHYGKPFLGDFLQAVKVPDSDYKLDPGDRKTIRETLPVNNNFLAFSQSMTSANPAAISMVNDYGQAIEKYATSLVARGKGTPKEAIKTATDLIIGQAYGFAVVDDVPVAVKRQQGTTNLTDDDIKNVQSWLRQSRYSMNGDNVDPKQFNFPSGISDEMKKTSIKDTLNNDSFWVTNPANDGATLFMNGVDGTTQQIKGKDGKPIESKFVDALNRHKQWVTEMRNSQDAYMPGGM
ncbi:hypothetical protein UFOVP1090_27 [uncultured Caudovirales phage]|uniref:Uncharacterized protein n=1 Tax=uncultured Caudovirales phage TaxID=2100421 RepID=A0A6J5QMF9_9CAUD|nr:hypothetical protein UFOVP1090_27 [uncultured Caudovirales phage]